MSGGQRRAVVEAVADHQHLRALAGEARDRGELVLGQHPRLGGQAKFARDGRDRARPIARQDRRGDAERGEFAGQVPGAGAKPVAEADA